MKMKKIKTCKIRFKNLLNYWKNFMISQENNFNFSKIFIQQKMLLNISKNLLNSLKTSVLFKQEFQSSLNKNTKYHYFIYFFNT